MSVIIIISEKTFLTSIISGLNRSQICSCSGADGSVVRLDILELLHRLNASLLAIVLIAKVTMMEPSSCLHLVSADITTNPTAWRVAGRIGVHSRKWMAVCAGVHHLLRI
jgi:hypothetical protein